MIYILCYERCCINKVLYNHYIDVKFMCPLLDHEHFTWVAEVILPFPATVCLALCAPKTHTQWKYVTSKLNYLITGRLWLRRHIRSSTHQRVDDSVTSFSLHINVSLDNILTPDCSQYCVCVCVFLIRRLTLCMIPLPLVSEWLNVDL